MADGAARGSSLGGKLVVVIRRGVGQGRCV